MSTPHLLTTFPLQPDRDQTAPAIVAYYVCMSSNISQLLLPPPRLHSLRPSTIQHPLNQHLQSKRPFHLSHSNLLTYKSPKKTQRCPCTSPPQSSRSSAFFWPQEGSTRRGFSGLRPQLPASYTKSFPSPETQQASLSSSPTTVILIGLAGAVLLALSSSPSPVLQSQQDQAEHKEPSSPTSGFYAVAEAYQESNMTGELPAGRPGALTPEQEEKLRQFWIAAGKVFGIIDDTFLEELSGEPNGASPESKDTKDKPKKKFGVFSRRNKGDKNDGDFVPSAETGHSRSQSLSQDDKYGQTKQFHDTVAKTSPETLRKTCWSMVKHDNPDALFLRFLRARKWDVEKALIMLISTMNWRHAEAHTDEDVILNGEEGAIKAAKTKDEVAVKAGSGEDFMAQIRMGKSFLHGVDKLGRPMCYVRARLHHQGEQSEASLERYTVYTIETARMLLSQNVDTACVIFDMTGFSLANMDYAPVKFMIKCFEANYPESLGVVLVHKAPWVFQGVWKIIKGWLDPVVASKVQFTNTLADLSTYIEPRHVLRDFGGDEDWEYRYIEPIAGENARMKDTATRDRLLSEREAVFKKYEEATKEWIRAAEGGRSTKVIKEKRAELAENLRTGYWKLDPYIRARSLYDRTGVIDADAGGKIDFYPKALKNARTSIPAEPSAKSPARAVRTTESNEADFD